MTVYRELAPSPPQNNSSYETTTMRYTYNADGEKLQATPEHFHLAGESVFPSGTQQLDGALRADSVVEAGAQGRDGGVMPPALDLSTRYCGNVIFERGSLKMLLTDEGYATIAANGTPTYHFYLTDHLGNNRMVVSANGTVEQVNHYYPYGGLMGESTGGSVQPYKYNGKELERMNGLDLYDYGARWMDGALGRFTTMDPLCEKYYGISPYAYCGGNPINKIDPDGRDEWEINSQGQIVNSIQTKKHDAFFMVDDENKRIESKSISFKYGTIIKSFKSHDEDGDKYDVYTIRGDANATNLFEFMAENTSVEWGHMKLGIEGDKGYNVLTTSHEETAEYGAVDMFNKQYRFSYNMREHTHSHPHNTPRPSGITDDSTGEDMKFARQLQTFIPQVKLKIYIPKTKKYINYNKNSTLKDFEL